MEDASSDFSDWEVLSAASAPDDVVVLVSGGQGGDVLHDHFGLDDPSSFHAADASTWSEAAASEDEEVESGLGSVHRFDSISPEPVDLTAAVVNSTAQLRLSGVDVTAQGSVLPASSASSGGATWTAHDEQIQEAEREAARGCGELDSIPAHHGVKGILDSDATAAVDGARVQTEDSGAQSEDGGAESSIVQLEYVGADATAESSVLEATASSDEVQTPPAEEEPVQAKDASATASGCGESDGDVKDCSSPLVAAAAPATGEGGESRVVVWWRLPFRLIHYCAWKVKPVWSVSIAAAFLGIVVLGRRMYRMRRKARGLPQIKIALDDKRASQFADRAARLNEAFLIAKRIPALRTSSGAALPWSMMQER